MSGFSGQEVPPLLATYLQSWFGDQPPRLAIHPQDEMLAFLTALYDGEPDRGLVAYFDSGRRLFSTFDQIVRWRFGSWGEVSSLLDFASGYGRVTRFLIEALPAERITIAEILPKAVEFQQRSFGVKAVQSAPRPAQLALDERFDAIFVTSLFTHLPSSTFGDWLHRLSQLLTPRGLLAFSVHDLSLLAPQQRPDDGFHFVAVSENESLAKDEYGSAWADQRWVGKLLGELGLFWHRLPRALCNVQDLYVASFAPLELDGLRLAGDLEGYVDHVRLSPGPALFCRGWAADHRGGNPLTTIVVELDGREVARQDHFGRRPDVAEALQLDLEQVGAWELTVELAPPAESRGSSLLALLAIYALSANGQRRLLHLSTVEGALFRSARLEVEALRGELENNRAHHAAEMTALEQRLRVMEASRFWKLRNRWFALKRALGLSGER